MKYFGNSNPKKKEYDEVEEGEEVEGHEENDKEDLNLEESSSDACVSTENKNNLSEKACRMKGFLARQARV